MKKMFFLASSALLLAHGANAQMHCATDIVNQRLIAQHPEIKEWEAKLGKEIADALALKQDELLKYGKTTATTYDLPIVVHIVHDYGLEYISDDDIFEAVAYWDKVYNKENADTVDVLPNFKKYIGNPQIRIHLATKDPYGNPTKGITRDHSYTTKRGSDNAKVNDWPNDKYLNIWIVNKFNADHSGAAAYAYYPYAGASMPQYDGVICVYSYYNNDKTIPHEIGHTLNLAHVWGNTNNPEVSCGDDGVTDTPPTYGHTSCTTTDLYDTRCATGYTDDIGVWHPNSPLAADTANTQNIMDYSYCSKMFTHGQADRMCTAITSTIAKRNNLISASNLAATGALAPRPDLKPIPDFSVEKGIMSWGGATTDRAVFLCQGSTTKFQFKNRSWNDTIIEVKWTLSNGASTPTASSLGTVQSTFTDPGWVTVTQEATGNNSGTSTISRKAVYVASNTAYSFGYNQYFGAEADYANWPTFNYFNNNFRWEFAPANGYGGWGCIRYRSYDNRSVPEKYSQSQEGDFDDMFSPAFDLNQIASVNPSGNVNLNFYTAAGNSFASSGSQDSLEIFISNNCGDTWQRLTVLKGSQIINNTAMGTEFAPTNTSQWKAQTIPVPAAMRSSKSFLRFRFWPSEGGNNFYLDNFSISPWTTGINEVAQNKTAIDIVPNPTQGSSKLCFTSVQNNSAQLLIRDLTGKTIYTESLHFQPHTFVMHNIDRAVFPAAGIYIVSLIQNESTNNLKLIVE